MSNSPQTTGDILCPDCQHWFTPTTAVSNNCPFCASRTVYRGMGNDSKFEHADMVRLKLKEALAKIDSLQAENARLKAEQEKEAWEAWKEALEQGGDYYWCNEVQTGKEFKIWWDQRRYEQQRGKNEW